MRSPHDQPASEPDSHDDVLRAKLGNRDAFERLVILHQERLRAWVGRYLAHGDDISEVVQETFLGALNHLHQVDPQRPFGAWLHGICRNQLYRFLQRRMERRSRQQGLVDQAVADTLPRSDDGEATSHIAALRHCLALLGDDQRDLLNERYRDAVAVQVLAQRRNTSANGISMRLLRLKEVLAKCIRSRLETPA